MEMELFHLTLILLRLKGVKIKLNSAVNGEVTVPFELMDEPTPNEVKQMDFSKMEIE